MLRGYHFEALHCSGITAARFPEFFSAAGGSYDTAVLDLYDYESRKLQRYARTILKRRSRLYFLIGTYEAFLWRRMEDRAFSNFDRICVCSAVDKSAFLGRFKVEKFYVVPNVIDDPGPSATKTASKVTLIFVGSFGYPPNRDGAAFFCSEVVPHLRTLTRTPFQVMIVGARPDATLLGFDNGNDIRVFGSVPDVAPFYAQADAAVAPIRAGGGTRIKILEAFGHGLPVVSTTLGAEGLEITPGTDILIADTAQDFATACARLLDDAALRARIGEGGRRLYESHYSPAQLSNALANVYEAANG